MGQGLCRRIKRTVAGFSSRLPLPRDLLTGRVLGSPCRFSFLRLGRRRARQRLRSTLTRGVSHFLLRLNGKFTFIKHRVRLQVPKKRAFFPSVVFCRAGLGYCIIVRLGIIRFVPRFTKGLGFCISTTSRLLGSSGSGPDVKLLVYGSGSRAMIG